MPYRVEQYLTTRACTGGVVSPDGGSVAFLSNVTGRPQVWLVGAESGWPRQVTFTDETVRTVNWSPGGDWLCFSMDRAGDERHQLYRVRPDGTELARLTDDDRAIHQSPRWSPDGRTIAFTSNTRDARYFDVWTVDLATNVRECVLETSGSCHVQRFSPDGRSLLLTRVNGSLDDDLLLLDLATGETRLLTPHEGAVVCAGFDFVDDRTLVGLSDREAEYLRVVRIDVVTTDWEVLVEHDWDIDGLAVARGGGRIAYAVNRDGAAEVCAGPWSSPRRIGELPRGTVAGLNFDAQARGLVFDHQGPSHPPDVWRWDLDDLRLTAVTRSDTAGIPRSAFRDWGLIHYATFDGREIPAWWVVPDSAPPAAGWPVVVWIHGGPESQTRAQFTPLIQYLVERGYAVLAPNVRGSTGYGRAYHQLDNKELRPNAVRDAALAVDWLRANGADPKRIACLGGSYGGFMVLSLVTGYPELWAAAVDLYGVANFETFFEHTGPYRRKHRASEYGDPETEVELLRALSPIHRVDRIVCPLMVVQGATDPRVPQHESDQMVAALRARGVPVEYLVFPDEGHGIVQLPNKITCYGGIAAFLERHLGA